MRLTWGLLGLSLILGGCGGGSTAESVSSVFSASGSGSYVTVAVVFH